MMKDEASRRQPARARPMATAEDLRERNFKWTRVGRAKAIR
jgi:hypothetical protein